MIVGLCYNCIALVEINQKDRGVFRNKFVEFTVTILVLACALDPVTALDLNPVTIFVLACALNPVTALDLNPVTIYLLARDLRFEPGYVGNRIDLLY